MANIGHQLTESTNFDNGFEKVGEEFVGGIEFVGPVRDEYHCLPTPAGPASPPRNTAAATCAPIKGTPRETHGAMASTEHKKTSYSIQTMDPRVIDLIFWKDVKKTGVVFGSAMVLLLSLAMFSVLSVIAYLALVILTITVSFRIYKNIMAAVQKTGEGHPFMRYLEIDFSMPQDRVHKCADCLSKEIVKVIGELRRLFLVEDLFDSIKFGFLLWILTCVGAWFNGMTIIIMAWTALFALPKIYDDNKVEIDQFMEMARKQITILWKQVQEKIPPALKPKSA